MPYHQGPPTLDQLYSTRRLARRYLDDFNPFVGQGFSSRFGWVSGDTADLVLLGQGRMGKNAFYNGATLLAGGTKDCEDLTHCRFDYWLLWDLGLKEEVVRVLGNGSKAVDEG